MLASELPSVKFPSLAQTFSYATAPDRAAFSGGHLFADQKLIFEKSLKVGLLF